MATCKNNYDLLKNNITSEVVELKKPTREIFLSSILKITQNAQTEQLETVTETKHYMLICDKQIVEPDLFHSYLYRYTLTLI